ncbi:MAG TPA: helix-turn-helix transcriptional regulator [Gemmatimonadaceae bacterium]|nr:helix-turn-helix transcriptional regulator [Gemmatimonadaceae bacterium]
MDITQFSQALIDARERAGLTQRAVASKANMPQPALARLERGRGNPTLETLERIAAALGADVSIELVSRTAPDETVERYKRDVDRTLLRENLRRSVDQRLRSLGELQLFGSELRRSMRARQAKR